MQLPDWNNYTKTLEKTNLSKRPQSTNSKQFDNEENLETDILLSEEIDDKLVQQLD